MCCFLSIRIDMLHIILGKGTHVQPYVEVAEQLKLPRVTVTVCMFRLIETLNKIYIYDDFVGLIDY